VDSMNRSSRPDLFAQPAAHHAGGNRILANLEHGGSTTQLDQDCSHSTAKPSGRAIVAVICALLLACAATWVILVSRVQPGSPDPVFRVQASPPAVTATPAALEERAAAIVNEPLPSLVPRAAPLTREANRTNASPRTSAAPVAGRSAKVAARSAVPRPGDSDVALLTAIIAHTKSKQEADSPQVPCSPSSDADATRCPARGCATQAECQED
jgi:hypothetical protein